MMLEAERCWDLAGTENFRKKEILDRCQHSKKTKVSHVKVPSSLPSLNSEG